ncbi:oxygen-insensitive NADPH nitroreductase [Paenilisteria rocourtiae]|uniref:FMN reductase (NADPH) n=1 Tax=Listeria rocourtiae TaxID=647910 RepID=A0A4R6ZRZ0_9LIST|nr:oxygen-insensitive NADPH nitroreductase [Listeria rocourtiae]EUJ49240.1 putative Nitroflavin-reductase [Listeria rocourtiae FSL F6-920]MBC1434574.1 oxygen-insensitive NADPH nitroreductase [Listeria rocourtiae]MBC1603266.1 oxygen-insensitive NADPH nitroreductase [Listeria rocourtiae]TDR55450.1 FMN reductase (NADPH) [Listeria rocourtiae]
MNETIEGILSHYSVRDFTDQALTENEIALLVKSAQAASTSSFVQAYSIIGVSDKKLREELSVIAGRQDYVVKTGQFFVFVADLSRHYEIGKARGVDTESLSSVERFLVATVDATLAAQNMAIAAESMGLGICYIGGIRNNLAKVSDLLHIPDYATPLFGLTIGHPTTSSEPKPRLSTDIVYHENQYQPQNMEDFKKYDATIRDYYEARTGGKRVEGWTDQIERGLRHTTRQDIKAFLASKNLGIK